MPCEPLGIRNNHLRSGRTKSTPQALDFCSRGTTLGGRIRLMTHEHGIVRERRTIDARRLHSLSHQQIHLTRNVIGVEPCSMEGRIRHTG